MWLLYIEFIYIYILYIILEKNVLLLQTVYYRIRICSLIPDKRIYSMPYSVKVS